MDKVSIIIPCYNQGEYLSEAINSAIVQTYPNTEIIIVNDGSTDDTVKILLERKFPTFIGRVIHHTDNKGLSSARNTGIDAARGRWIVCLDADDKLDLDYIRKLLEADKPVVSYDVIGCGTQEFGTRDVKWKTHLKHPYHRHFVKKNRLNYASMFRKDVWQDLGGFDENMKMGFEDWDFWIRAAKESFRFVVTNDYLFHYRRKEDSMFERAKKQRKEILEYMSQKHGIKIG